MLVITKDLLIRKALDNISCILYQEMTIQDSLPLDFCTTADGVSIEKEI